MHSILAKAGEYLVFFAEWAKATFLLNLGTIIS